MQTKQHYKMYKDGKHWVFAAITVAAVGLGTMMGQGTIAHADTTTANDESTSQTGTTSSSSTSSVTLATSSATGSATTGSTDKSGTAEATATSDATDTSEKETAATDQTSTTDTTTPDESGQKETSTNAGTSSTKTDTSTTVAENASGSSEAASTTPVDTATSTDSASTANQTVTTSTGTDTTTPAENTGADSVKTATVPAGTAVSSDVLDDLTTTPASAAMTPMAFSAETLPVAATTEASATALKAGDTFSANGFNYTVNADGTSVTLTGANGTVTSSELDIAGTVSDGTQSYDVTAIGSYALWSNVPGMSNVTKITIGDNIKTIGEGAFIYLGNLQVVDFSENHALTEIGKNAFFGTGLTSLTLPDSVTTIDDGAFEYNAALTSVVFSANLKSIGNYAFGANMTTEDNVTTVNSSLTNLDFSKATQLENIGEGAFTNAAKLTMLDLPSATTIGQGAFSGDTSLTTVTLGSGVQNIGNNAFSAYSVTTADGTSDYGSDTALTTVNFSEGLQTIGTSAFAYAGGITTLNFPASLTSIGDYAFAVMTKKDSAGTSISGLTNITFANGSQLTTIGDSAFIYDSYLTNVTLPASLVAIGDQAFLANTALTTINLPASLQSVGANAFTYDTNLTSVDTSQATALTLIKSGAFEYTGLKGTLTLPTNLATIDALAFAGNHISSLVVNDALTTVGDSAFAYNDLGGALDLTTTGVTSIGKQAFYGNQLTSVALPTTTTVGADAFDYNRITSLTAPINTGKLALNQTATIFTSKAELTSIDKLFQVAVGNLNTANLKVSDLTEGVTYNATTGQFTIPTAVENFSFNWSLTDATGATYTGTYQVVLNDPAIKVANSTVWQGDAWEPKDNVVSAQMTGGATIDLNDLTVSVTDSQSATVAEDKMTQTPGVYTVTYTYEGESAAATVTVKARQATYSLSGTSEVVYNGATPTLDPTSYTLNLSDGFVYTLKAGDLIIQPTDGSTSNAGSYVVTLDPDAIKRVMSESPAAGYFNWTEDTSGNGASVTITKAPLTISSALSSTSKVAGEADPTVLVTVTDADGKPVTDSGLTAANITRAPGETVGTYQYALANDNGLTSNYTVTAGEMAALTITAAEPTLSGSNYTVNVGDPMPDASVFKPQATDENALQVENPQVTADYSQVNLTQAGTYPVTLSYTTNGTTVTTTVSLTVKDPSTNTGGGGSTVDPTDPTTPTDPATPTDPVDPATPTDPSKPATGDTHTVTSDKGVRQSGTGATVTVNAKHSAQQVLKTYRGGLAVQLGASEHRSTTGSTLKHGGDGALITTPHASASAATDPTTTVAATTLPQTNEAQTPWWSVLGILLGGLGLAGLRKRRHE